jgi:haloacetate dehalogenase
VVHDDEAGRSWPTCPGVRIARLRCGAVRLNVRIEGAGPPLLLLHGYPQTHRIWRRCLDILAPRCTCIMPDLRGYGDSDKPIADAAATAYGKRAMADDLVHLLDRLGIARCAVAGHDRGARVAHRLALDHGSRVAALAVIDVLPTIWHDRHRDRAFANAYWHWPFLAAGDEPARLLAADPVGFLDRRLAAWSRTPGCFAPEDLADYRRCFSDPACLAATCADYRAAAGVDLDDDTRDEGRRLNMPLLAMWGARGFIGTTYDPPAVWRGFADDVHAAPIDCGHFPPEERPDETAAALLTFFAGRTGTQGG